MRNKILLGTSLFCIIVFFSCRKIDQPANDQSSSSSELKFFNTHISAKSEVKAISEYVKRQNQKYHFVEQLTQRIGVPRWDKALIVNSRGLYRKNSSDTTDLIYIPFVRENENYVNASLLIQTSSTDTVHQFLCNWQYSQRNHGSLNIDSTAEHFAMFFMLMDNMVFGHNEFNLLDPSLFSNNPQNDTSKKRITFSSMTNELKGRGLSMSTMIIFEAIICGTPQQCDDRGKCDWDEPCWLNPHVCYLTTGWYDFDENVSGGEESGGYSGGNGIGGGTGQGGGEGSGEPGGGWIPPPCPGGVARGQLYDNCTPAWSPDYTVPPLNPCDTLAKYSQGADFAGIFGYLKTQVLTRSENIMIFHNTLLPGSSTNALHLVNGHPDEFSVYPSDEALFVGSWGWFHNHFADPDSALLTFSAGDLNILADQLVRDAGTFQMDYTKFMMGMVGDSNTQYILMIEDFQKFSQWATTYSSEYLISALYGGSELNQKYLPLSVAETEKRFLKVIDQTGLKLFRGSNDFRTWTPIIRTRAGNVADVPCPQ